MALRGPDAERFPRRHSARHVSRARRVRKKENGFARFAAAFNMN